MGVLAAYDTVGIQNYIFASNKLAENVGGSILVADIFVKVLPQAITAITGQQHNEWRGKGALNPSLKVEIIYQGGGNAFVAFADEKDFQDVTKDFLIRTSQTAPGVGIAVAAIETDFKDNYKRDFAKLNDRLTLVKGGFNIPVFAGNQPITKQSGRTGLPVSSYRDDEYLSEDQVKKRDRYKVYKSEHKSNIEVFDDLAFEKGSDSLIAIVHVDGNNMGKHIKSIMDQFDTYKEAVSEIRKLSEKIDKCYKEALQRTITAFKAAYQEYVIAYRATHPSKEHSDKQINPPMLELIGDGDDTTLVISGRFAIDFSARLLREIEKTCVENRPFKDIVPYACAGVVLFHSHFPFSEAYKLAEELCTSAKKPSRETDGSYIDFHIHQSGNVAGLSALRDAQYRVDGLTVLRRPWRVTEGYESEQPNFKWFEKHIKTVKDMPRNKTKAIRNAIGAGDKAVEIALSQLRYDKLPERPIEPDEKMSKYAHYFDILEISDDYENLLNKEVGNSVE